MSRCFEVTCHLAPNVSASPCPSHSSFLLLFLYLKSSILISLFHLIIPTANSFSTSAFSLFYSTSSSSSFILLCITRPLQLAGFSELSQDDQLILIKVGFLEVWLTHVSRMVSALDNTLTFSDGSYVTRSQMEVMFDVSSERVCWW